MMPRSSSTQDLTRRRCRGRFRLIKSNNAQALTTSNLDASLLSCSSALAWSHAPRADWSQMHDTDHFVQFYEADGLLLSSLSGFIGSAISSGDGAIVIATESHRSGLEKLITANGLDIASAKSHGQFVSLDAAETLAQFMVDGLPEPGRFQTVIGEVIASVTDGRARVK